MNVSEGILILVTFAGPVAAVQAQKWVERNTAKRRGKVSVFRTLMATRGAFLSPDHVKALNMIDLEFYAGGTKEQRVREAWKQYLDHLNTRYDNDTSGAWGRRQIELLVELLYEMSECVGYRFDKTHIKNTAYSPMAHGNMEQEQNVIRSGLVNILTGKAAFPIVAKVATDEEAKEQADLRRLLIAYLSDSNPRPVRIVSDPIPTASVSEEEIRS
jgi:hypothetical protein